MRRETGHTHKHTTRITPHNTRYDQNNTTNDHTKNHLPALNKAVDKERVGWSKRGAGKQIKQREVCI